MARGKGPKPKSQTPKRLPPRGHGPIKRTPKHEFDHGDNSENIYDVESILAERIVKIGNRPCEEWLIRWKGYGQADDTWEPIENLAGLEDDIAKFRNERNNRETVRLGKRKRRTPVDSQTPVVVPASANSENNASDSAPPVSSGQDDDNETDGVTEILRPAMRGRRTAKVWHIDFTLWSAFVRSSFFVAFRL